MTETLYLYLSKLLPWLVMPLSLVLLLLIAGLILLLRGPSRPAREVSAAGLAGSRRSALALLVLALASLWIFSMPVVAGSLLGYLERQFPPTAIQDLPDADCIVILGGAVSAPLAPRQDIELGEAVDRVYQAVQLYRAGKAGQILVSAGNQPWAEPGPSEATLTGELLVQWGVPAAALQLEGRSRNTRENALFTQPLLAAAGCQHSLLVTSAAHMPRALASFKALGMNVHPVSTDVRVTDRSRFRWVDFLPEAQALAMTSAAIREWVGQKVYEWNGWN